MSVIRFLHTDYLRLGSPVAGLSDSPDWLRKVAASAVRTAVTNVVEAAIAGRCQFLLIAGRLTESDHDLDVAVAWLMAQSTLLKDHGIQLVLAGYSESEHSSLRSLGAILLSPGQRLDVWSAAGDKCSWTVASRTSPARTGALSIEAATAVLQRSGADFVYVADAALKSSVVAHSFDGVAVSHERHLRLSAGCPQSLGPAERGQFGCQMVEADMVRMSLTARFCSTDVIRFSQELINCRSGMTATQLSEQLRDRSRAIATTGRCTSVVEWVIGGQISLSSSRDESLCELELLRELRASVNAGHSGAWPCRIRFSDNSTVDVVGTGSAVAQEFSAVVRDRLHRDGHRRIAGDRSVIGIPLGHGSEAAVGLDVLRRVA